MLTRTWARRITTTYGYDANAGNLLTLGYSDSTPVETFTYDRLGRQKTVADGTGSRAFTYNDALQFAFETNALATVTRSYDVLSRAVGIALNGGYAVGYGYDALGRLQLLAPDNSSHATALSLTEEMKKPALHRTGALGVFSSG